MRSRPGVAHAETLGESTSSATSGTCPLMSEKGPVMVRSSRRYAPGTTAGGLSGPKISARWISSTPAVGANFQRQEPSDTHASSEWSAAMTARIGRLRVRHRTGPIALLPERALNEPRWQRHDPSEVPCESLAGREWDGRVAREVSHQARIEAAFDRAEGCERLGDFRCALEWLDRAEDLGGGLPPEYRARRARLAGQLTRRPPSALNGTGSGEGFVFEVRGGPDAGVAARQAVLAGNGALPASVRAEVLLLVTELVTNAVRHAGVGPEQPVRVGLRRLPQRVRVEVTDPGSGFAQVRPRSNGDESGGWGLLLVDRIADSWGAWPTASGTCVWFEVRAEEDADASG